MNIGAIRFRIFGLLISTLALAVNVFCDIPPADPSNPKKLANELAGTDWVYIASGALFAFAGALILVWIGRKISKRSLK